MKKNLNIIIVISLALFSMFFGAGNLIFPPHLGYLTGQSFISSSIGFILSSILITFLSVIATVKSGGTIDSMSSKIGNNFSKIFGTIIILTIGPCLAIPRTAATTFEVLKKTIFPNLIPSLSSLIFFIIILILVLNPSTVVDKLGKYLTPFLLLILAIILISGIIHPLGPLMPSKISNPLVKSFEEGYQTMDALAALIFSTIIVKSFVNKGIDNKKELTLYVFICALFSAIALLLVYSGLIYVGATTSGFNISNMGRTEFLIFITDNLLGNYGKIALALAIALACLTTAIGLTVTVGDYFQQLTNSKISYKFIIILSSVFSGITAINGVDNIVKISAPILTSIYPVVITLVFLNLFNVSRKSIYLGAVIGAFLPSLINIIFKFINLFGNVLGYKFNMYINIPSSMSLFGWIIPAIIFSLIFFSIDKVKNH